MQINVKSKLLYLFTRTPLHIGAGSDLGAIDQPIRRERHTGLPIIPGSSLKGVLADHFLCDRMRGLRSEEGIQFFGRQEHEVDMAEPAKLRQSGSISIREARLLAFPVRSAKDCFAWITSPLLLERWRRDTQREGPLIEQKPDGADIYGSKNLELDNYIVLEDCALEYKGSFEPHDLSNAIHDSLWKNLAPKHLCLVSDDMMSYYSRTACEVAQHVSIDDQTGAAADHKLFNQENVPAETLFYSVLTELRPDVLEKLKIPPLLQIGGNATTGLGFCTAELVPLL